MSEIRRVSEVAGYVKAPYLINWMVKKGKVASEAIRDHAGEVGTLVDICVQNDIFETGFKDIVADDCRKEFDNCIDGWEAFKNKHPEFIEKARKYRDNMQIELVDKAKGLTGHPDFCFPDELPDLKTSSSIKEDHWRQVVAYARMANAQLKYRITKLSIVWLDKKNAGNFKYVVVDNVKERNFWEDSFDRRLALMNEDSVYAELKRKQLEGEKLL